MERKLRQRLTDEELQRFERYTASIFVRVGMDLNTPSAREAPRRWLTALWDMTEGYEDDSKKHFVFGRVSGVSGRRENSYSRRSDPLHWPASIVSFQ
jgi:GTP cyclohydrolase I